MQATDANIRTLKPRDVRFSIEADWMDESPEAYYGDDDVNATAVRRQIREGNVWGWALVTVRATLPGFSHQDVDGLAVLGACSYRNERGFKRGGYYQDMKKDALERLNE